MLISVVIVVLFKNQVFAYHCPLRTAGADVSALRHDFPIIRKPLKLHRHFKTLKKRFIRGPSLEVFTIYFWRRLWC